MINMKRINSIILFLLFILNTQLFAENKIFGEYEYFVNDDKTITIVGINANYGDFNIPETIEDMPVTTLAKQSCSKSTMHKVTIPNTVKYIEEEAFADNGLVELKIPDGILYIGDRAFANSQYLTTIVLPNKDIDLGKGVFVDCPSLKAIKDPDGNYIGDENFLVINDSIICYIGKEANVIVPSTINGVEIKKIANNAFFSNRTIKNVTLPNSIVSIGNSAFEECRYLERINIPDDVASIGDKVFKYCYKLTDISLPNKITVIPYESFRLCIALNNVKLSDDIEVINDNAFRDCKALNKITLPEKIKHIGNGVFENCPQIKEIIIPTGCLYIGDKAFNECTSLEKIVIPTTVTNFGANLFWLNRSLKYIVDENGDSLNEKDYIVFENKIIYYFANEQDLVIPQNIDDVKIEKIGDNAFYNKTMSSIVIPENITEIGQRAFMLCKDLIRVTIEGQTKEISPYTFAMCKILREINIPETTLLIGESAFMETDLKNIIIPSNVEHIEKGAFANCKSLKEVYIPNPNTKFDKDVFFKSPNVIIYTTEGTTADKYAKDNNIKIEYLK